MGNKCRRYAAAPRIYAHLDSYVTHIGHWLLTELLVPALAAAARSSPDGYSRVVTTSSAGAYLNGLYYEAFRESPLRKKLGNKTLYQQSKLVSRFLGLMTCPANVDSTLGQC